MPPALTDSVLRLAQAEGNDIDKIALAQDLRGRKFFSDIAKTLKSLDNQHINYKVIYLEAADSILIRRYNETRRSHPLSKAKALRRYKKEGGLHNRYSKFKAKSAAQKVIQHTFRRQAQHVQL